MEGLLVGFELVYNKRRLCGGDFIFLYPSADLNSEVGVEVYKTILNQSSETYFKPLIMEKIVETKNSHCSDKWVVYFEDRYLDFGKIGNIR